MGDDAETAKSITDVDALENAQWILLGERYKQKKEAKKKEEVRISLVFDGPLANLHGSVLKLVSSTNPTILETTVS